MTTKLDSVMGQLTCGAEDTNTSLNVVKRSNGNVVEYTVYAPYLNCPYIRLPRRLWSFVRARWLLRSHERVRVKLSLSPGIMDSTCEYGTRHTTRVFRATLRVTTHDANAIQELLKFEESIRYYYYACQDWSTKTA